MPSRGPAIIQNVTYGVLFLGFVSIFFHIVTIARQQSIEHPIKAHHIAILRIVGYHLGQTAYNHVFFEKVKSVAV